MEAANVRQRPRHLGPISRHDGDAVCARNQSSEFDCADLLVRNGCDVDGPSDQGGELRVAVDSGTGVPINVQRAEES